MAAPETGPRVSLTLPAVLSLIGFTAVIGQVVLMRELMVVSGGNELSLGLMLATWLLWTALGSGVLGRWRPAREQPRRLVAALEALSAAALPLALLVVRAARAALRPVTGELLSPAEILATSLAALGLFCPLSGWLFAAGSRLYAREAAATTAAATARVYWLEALGSGAGGLLAALLLTPHLGSFRIALLAGALNLLAASALALSGRARRLAQAGIALALLLAPAAANRLEAVSLAWLWRGFRVIEERNSPYGNLTVIETEGSRTLYESGLAAGTAPDPAAAEEAVHYALLQHPAPRRLLLIGGGWNGSLRQALEHPTLERVDYVELDPAVLELAGRRFAEEWLPAAAEPRVCIHAADGRLYLKTAPGPFDVIIVNLPEPSTAQLNRFYTLEFFRLAAAKLGPEGVLALRLRASENYISPERARLLGSIRDTLRAVFPGVALLPGETVHLLATRRPEVLTRDADALAERLRARGLRTQYVREYYFRFRLTPARVQALEEQIGAAGTAPLNRDLAPIAYYFDAVLWGAQFDRRYGDLFQAAAGVGLGRVAAGLALLMGLLATLAGRAGAAATAALAVAAMGFSSIALEVLLLVGFQVLYGYVYHQLSLVIAAFMAGMALGSRRALAGSGRRDAALLAGLQSLAAGAALLLYAVFAALGGVSGAAGLWAVSHLGFPALALGCGWMGGYQFPVAGRIYFGGERAEAPGGLYALDLAGACLGAVLVSAYALPVFGFLGTAWLLALVNGPVAAALLARRS